MIVIMNGLFDCLFGVIADFSKSNRQSWNKKASVKNVLANKLDRPGVIHGVFMTTMMGLLCLRLQSAEDALQCRFQIILLS